MEELINLINEISVFGQNPNVICDDKELKLKSLLVCIYSYYFELDVNFDDNDYSEFQGLTYQEIRKNVESNFPKSLFYISVHDSHIVNYKKGESNPIVNATLGDPTDDITDIIGDLLEVKWRYENNSIDDAIWYFNLQMRTHTEWHIVNFLKYLKDKQG